MPCYSRGPRLVLAFLALAVGQAAGRQAPWRQEVAHRLDRQDYTTAAPLIGVLTQPTHEDQHEQDQSMSGPLVSWIESAGGRVVPIRYNAPWEEVEEVFASINGLVLPGGAGKLWYGHPFFDTAARLLQLARAENQAGGIFPVFGICLGFETLHILLANVTREELLVKAAGQESVSNTIELTGAAEDSLFFRRWPADLLAEVGDKALTPTFNAHEWAVPLSAYRTLASLDNQLAVLSTSDDAAGKSYVSTVEGRDMPLFATQWHPEKTPYEFADADVPHTRTAIRAAALTAELLVDVARLNDHKVPYARQVALVIDNYSREFLAPQDQHAKKSDDRLPDTLWFVPDPSDPRGDLDEPVASWRLGRAGGEGWRMQEQAALNQA